MKKLFSAFTAVLLAFCFISCAPQELSDRSSKNEGSVSLSIRSPRTISPAEGISYTAVPKWTVTFRDTTAQYDDIIVKDVIFNESSPQEIRLPIGTYNVTLNGTANASSEETLIAQPVPFYGEASVTVEGGTPVPISVFVAPKKSADGTGSFNFTVTTSGFGNNPPTTNIVDISTGRNNYFTVSLTPRGDEIPVATWTPTEISSSATTSETGDIYSFSVSSDTLELQSVPSGFYTLSIKYTWVVGAGSIGQPLTKTKEIYSPYHDFLVEIIDGLTTNGSADITVSLEDSKTYYATTDATKAKGNGAFASMPGYFDDVLAAIKDTTISTANIIMVDSLAADGTTIYPEIDVSKVNATGVWYEISVLTSEGGQKHCYSIKDEDGDGNPTIYTEVDTVNLKDSSAAGKPVDVRNIVELTQLQLSLKNNTSVAIKFEVRGPVILDEIDSFDYYSTHPFMTAEYQISDLYLSSNLASYTTASKTISASEYEYYILPAVQANPIINGFAYDLVVTKDGLSVTDTLLYAGDTVTITATSKSEGGSFADGTTFVWFINGKRTDCTDQSYTIKFGEGDAVAENTIICLVGYNGEYATKSIVLTAQENTIVLYNNTSDTTKPALSYATLTDVSSPTVLLAKDSESSPIIVDYCFDDSNNLYAIVRKTETTTTYSINKYAYSNKYDASTVATYTIGVNENVSAIDYIEASNDGKLYAVITRSTESTTSTSIAELDLTSSNDTVGFTGEYALPTNWPSGDNTYYYIQTFCTDGTNFYFILLKTSPETSSYNLVSCTVSVDNQLTENKSILLASTVEGAASVFSSSDYSDTLEYRDLCYINGKLYLLVRDVDYAITNNNPETPSTSRGALCTFTVSADGITADRIGIGYQIASSSISYTDYTGSSITRTAYIGDGSTTFYGPVKFVARKEDELLIADDGYCVDSSANVNTKNNIVKVNLKTESITGSYNLDSGYFDYYYSGQFGSSIYINGSQIY